MQDPYSVAERKKKAAALLPETPPVHLVVLADTQGSIDAVTSIVEAIPQDEVRCAC